MRYYVILTIITISVLWAFDAYQYKGRYRAAFWQETNDLGRNFSHEVQRLLDKAMSGH
jgi:hypothetical protein